MCTKMPSANKMLSGLNIYRQAQNIWICRHLYCPQQLFFECWFCVFCDLLATF